MVNVHQIETSCKQTIKWKVVFLQLYACIESCLSYHYRSVLVDYCQTTTRPLLQPLKISTCISDAFIYFFTRTHPKSHYGFRSHRGGSSFTRLGNGQITCIQNSRKSPKFTERNSKCYQFCMNKKRNSMRFSSCKWYFLQIILRWRNKYSTIKTISVNWFFIAGSISVLCDVWAGGRLWNFWKLRPHHLLLQVKVKMLMRRQNGPKLSFYHIIPRPKSGLPSPLLSFSKGHTLSILRSIFRVFLPLKFQVWKYMCWRRSP